MTITQLNYLIALEEHRHYGRAAKSCGVTQPTLSAQVNKLEQDLGQPLVNRKQQPLVLTELGEAVLQQARLVIQATQDIEQLSKQWDQPVEGVFRLGIIPTVAPYLVHRFAGPVTQRFKSLELEIKEASTKSLLEMVRTQVIDAAILAIPLDAMADDWVSWTLYDEPLVAYVPEGHPLANELFLSHSELERNDILLLPEGHCFRDQVLSICNKPRNSAIRVEVGQLETLIRMADAGLGMTLLPELAVMELPKDKQGNAKPLSEPRPVRRIALVQLPGQRKQGIAAALASVIQAQVPAKLLKQVDQDLVMPAS